MNVESLKSELQQVLDNDVVLRKEFNELKRSLSDYRNQLIMRDEDCKRLQVTIDVLNTKLVVMERDNTNYKSELTSFKELRGSIKEQLETKQTEIDARLEEIQALKNDLNAIAADYEQKIEAMRSQASTELERVKQEYDQQISELKANSHYKESGIREEFENRLSELSIASSEKEQSLVLNHEEQVMSLKAGHEQELSTLKSDYESRLAELSGSANAEKEALQLAHQAAISALGAELSGKTDELDRNYKTEVSALRLELESQRESLVQAHRAELETLKQEFSANESRLVSGYEKQLEELRAFSASASEDMSLSFQGYINNLKSSYEEVINQKNLHYVNQIGTLSEKYEERLANTLIHSNSQNTKLNEEMSKVLLENEQFKEKIREMSIHMDSKNSDIESLTLQLSHFRSQLETEEQRFAGLSAEFENFKQTTLLSNSDQVNELNTRIDGLNEELKNMGLLLESTTNSLGETELTLESKVQEAAAASQQIEELTTRIQSFDATLSLLESTTADLDATKLSLEAKVQELEGASAQISELTTRAASFDAELAQKEQAFAELRSGLEASTQEIIDNKELEYQKLLAENSNLIHEIDQVQDKVEAQEAEITLLKSELDELNAQTQGKVEHFKEALADKNFQITNLEANNAALHQELLQVKLEVARLEEQLQGSQVSDEAMSMLQHNFDQLNQEKHNLLSEIHSLQGIIAGLNENIVDMNARLTAYEQEIDNLKNSSPSGEQEAFIDRLFKQIDNLNDQRLALLDEKEQMAGQLLKMNDVVGTLSQQVESEDIDVTGLNNHRKNVILAKNSGENGERSHMKKQINDLVREIDKCIALLSA